MLTRIGAISGLTHVRYWSVNDKAWENLFTRGAALNGSDAKAVRDDFTASEFRPGADLYFLSDDNRSGSDMVTRLRVVSSDPDRIVWQTVNTVPLRAFFVSLIPAGGIETLYSLERTSDGWRFFSLTRITGVSSLLASIVRGDSYINRAAAMYRYTAGQPTDRDPPVAP